MRSYSRATRSPAQQPPPQYNLASVSTAWPRTIICTLDLEHMRGRLLLFDTDATALRHPLIFGAVLPVGERREDAMPYFSKWINVMFVSHAPSLHILQWLIIKSIACLLRASGEWASGAIILCNHYYQFISRYWHPI